MEYSEIGDLFDLILRYQDVGKYLSEADCWKIIIQLIRGIHVLHQNGIIHRDLKSQNIFMFRDGRIKLGDMNVALCRDVADRDQYESSEDFQIGTPFYSR